MKKILNFKSVFILFVLFVFVLILPNFSNASFDFTSDTGVNYSLPDLRTVDGYSYYFITIRFSDDGSIYQGYGGIKVYYLNSIDGIYYDSEYPLPSGPKPAFVVSSGYKYCNGNYGVFAWDNVSSANNNLIYNLDTLVYTNFPLRDREGNIVFEEGNSYINSMKLNLNYGSNENHTIGTIKTGNYKSTCNFKLFYTTRTDIDLSDLTNFVGSGVSKKENEDGTYYFEVDIYANNTYYFVLVDIDTQDKKRVYASITVTNLEKNTEIGDVIYRWGR